MIDINNVSEDRVFSEKTGNFETMNMIYKIKKIKKRRNKENMKKMEFPEILQNVNGVDETISTKIVEGFNDDEWEGYDPIKDDKEDVTINDPRAVLIRIINFIYNATVSYNRNLASSITKSLSTANQGNKDADKKKKPEDKRVKNPLDKGDLKNDENIVYKYICLIEAIIFTSFVVNNWYYLMFYNNFKEGEKVELFNFSADKINSLDENYILNKFMKYILLYFIEFSLFFPEKLEYFLINLFPGIVTKFMNHTLCYITLFLIILNISYNFASGFKNFMIDIINLNYNNVVVLLMFITVIVLFIIPSKKDNNHGATMTVLMIIWNIIRFLVTITISVPLGGFFCLFYFTFYSLFGMLYYSNWDVWKLAQTYKDMLMFIDNKKIGITGKPDPTFLELLILKVNEYLEYVSDNFLIIVILITFIYGLSDVASNIKDSALQSVLIFLFSFIILIVLTFLIYIIQVKFNITSFSDVTEVLNKLRTSAPIEKDYDSSTNIYFSINLMIYALSLGVISYGTIKFLKML
jgi:hypothetical protein